MRNVEHAEDLMMISSEIGDQEGTYEKKNKGDLGNQTVFMGSNAKIKGKKTQVKKKTKQEENVIFVD